MRLRNTGKPIAARFLTRQSKPRLEIPRFRSHMTPDDYVAVFDHLNNLKPAPIIWVTPKDGNYA